MNTRRKTYVDSHFHFGSRSRLDDLSEYFEITTILQAAALSLPDRYRINFNPEVLLAKAYFPKKLFAFASLDYSSIFYNNRRYLFNPEEQLKDFLDIGFDGIKMWLGKPTFQHDVSLTPQDPVFNRYFKTAEELSVPIIFHAGDPPDFWKNSKSLKTINKTVVPIYKSREYPPFDFFYNQAGNLASRYNGIRFIFPHLLFLADNLDKLGNFLDAHSNTMLDLSPGRYFYAELSKNRKEAINFFSTYSKRILFGTDSLFFSAKDKLLEYKPLKTNIETFSVLSGYLSKETEYPNTFPFSKESMPFVKGLGLNAHILEDIYHRNHKSLLGNMPGKIDFNSAIHYLSRFIIILTEINTQKKYSAEVMRIKTELETIKNRRAK